MNYLPQTIGMWFTRITGWTLVLLFGISIFAAIPLGNGIVGLLGSAAAAFCPGAALAFGAKRAFEGFRFWKNTVMILMSILALGFGVLGLSAGGLWLLIVYPIILTPIVVLFGTVKSTDSNEPKAKLYAVLTLALYLITVLVAWVLAVID
jgi:hypothetical protein